MPTLRSGPAPISSTLLVRAPARDVFDLLSDPRRHLDLDGSGTLRGRATGPERLVLGSRFGMSMRYWGIPYRITNTVTQFEPDRVIAWTHLSRVIWRYELTEVAGGTEITETWDPTGSPGRLVYGWLGFPGRVEPAIAATLRRIQQLVETAGGSGG